MHPSARLSPLLPPGLCPLPTAPASPQWPPPPPANRSKACPMLWSPRCWCYRWCRWRPETSASPPLAASQGGDRRPESVRGVRQVGGEGGSTAPSTLRAWDGGRKTGRETWAQPHRIGLGYLWSAPEEGSDDVQVILVLPGQSQGGAARIWPRESRQGWGASRGQKAKPSAQLPGMSPVLAPGWDTGVPCEPQGRGRNAGGQHGEGGLACPGEGQATTGWQGGSLSRGAVTGLAPWPLCHGSPDASLAGQRERGTGQGRAGSPLPAAPAHSPACSGWTLHISLGFGPEWGARAATPSFSPQACLGLLGGLPAILRRKGVRGTLCPTGLPCQGQWGRGGHAWGALCSHPVLTPSSQTLGGTALGDPGCHKVPQ